MSKAKLGISTLLTLVIFGLFSIVAFAAVPTSTGKPVATVNGQDVTVTWTAPTSGADSYNVYWDGVKTNQTELTFTKTGVAFGTEHIFGVEAVNADGPGPIKQIEVAVELKAPTVTKTVNGQDVTINWAAVAGADSYNVYWNGGAAEDQGTATTYTKNGVAYGSYTVKVESVGVGEKASTTVKVYVKAPTNTLVPPTASHPATGINVGTVDNNGNYNQHRTHGNFQNNTNSCANCHSTHNGEANADGGNNFLLMKGGEFDLCMACHDGTMGFYNVTASYEGVKGADLTAAGTFDDSHLSSSMHNVDSGVQIDAAPGAFDNKNTGALECSSCHNPHGSVNDRLLNEKVIGNQFARVTTVVSGYSDETIATEAVLPIGTKAITLNLTPDSNYSGINGLSDTTGLKIYKSTGPKNGTDRVNMSNFCAACHDDYLASSGKQRKDGHYSHTTNIDKGGRNCESCHYAHGTNINTLKDTSGKTIADLKLANPTTWTDTVASDYMKDVSAKGSSLKKFTNMAVCWACHQSTHQINTPGAVDSVTKTVINPIPGGDYSGKPAN